MPRNRAVLVDPRPLFAATEQIEQLAQHPDRHFVSSKARNAHLAAFGFDTLQITPDRSRWQPNPSCGEPFASRVFLAIPPLSRTAPASSGSATIMDSGGYMQRGSHSSWSRAMKVTGSLLKEHPARSGISTPISRRGKNIQIPRRPAPCGPASTPSSPRKLAVLHSIACSRHAPSSASHDYLGNRFAVPGAPHVPQLRSLVRTAAT